MGEDIIFSGCDLYADGKYIGHVEKIDTKIECENDPTISSAYTNFNKSITGKAIIPYEEIKKIVDMCNRALEPVKTAFLKLWESTRKFLDDNPKLVKKIKNRIKYEKRTRNRQRLYEKRKALGRKL